MTKNYSAAWKGSSRPGKQRKYRHTAPAHVRRAFLSSHLSKSLRQEYKRRAVPVRKGDRIKVMTGKHKGKTGSVERTDFKEAMVYITGIDRPKRDGSKQLIPIHASNIMIEELEMKDRERIESIRAINKRQSKWQKDT